MQFSTTVLISLLPALGLATRFRAAGSSSSSTLGQSAIQVQADDENAGRSSGTNDCGQSTFVAVTQDNNPSVKDCQRMLLKIQDDQQWNVGTEGVILVSYGTCSFGARLIPQDSSQDRVIGTVGNGDIIDLVTDSIANYAVNGTIGCHGGYDSSVDASGSMACNSPNYPSGQQVRIDWTVGPASS